MGLRAKRGEIVRGVLAVLAVSAVVLAAATFPGAAIALRPFFKRKSNKMKQRSVEAAVKRLKERRLVEIVMKNGTETLSITERGRGYLKRLDFDLRRLPVPKHWDGHWTVILFDIPETERKGRDALRIKLKQLGCFKFHKSVFVHPADCEDEIDFVTEIFGIRRYVTVFRTKQLGHQEYRAVRYFELS
ncbi:MAG: hypothetical protein HY220_02540 [Candidatus Sungbacteria bacterium]|uniref:Transcriptional repressor PaaX-like central Cas2-like domain-containing protein n=1 Tax=Candidatus Sungiibacteriota bacterium TaxID=2750080 RepID=A0A9D6LN88_9BACT|nr:hypothetical protein [Candidatus Sungbacteria bacterium]